MDYVYPDLGCTPWSSIDLDESEETVRIGATNVLAIHCINLAATPRYLKFYDGLIADVVVGTTVPKWRCAIPSSGSTDGGGFTLSIPTGLFFRAGLVVAATTGVADSDTGAPGDNEVVVNLAVL